VSRREDIDNSIWSDPDFNTLTPNAKLVYVWAFTNPRCGMAGLYKVIPGAIALETGLDADAITAALRELAETRFVQYERGVLWVRSRVKHLRTKTPQIAKAIARDVEHIGNDPLQAAFLAEYRSLGWLADPLQTLTRGSGDRHEISDTYGENGDPHPTVTRGSGDPLGNGQGRASSKEDASSRAREPGVAAHLDEARERLAAEADTLPDDLPEQLHQAARDVQQRLLRLHQRKPKSLRPPLVAVGRVMASLADRPHVDVADDVEHYWSYGPGQNKPVRDIVATYRNRLKTAPVVNNAPASQGRRLTGAQLTARAEERERRLEAERDRLAARAGS
jgi:hypothetical protein